MMQAQSRSPNYVSVPRLLKTKILKQTQTSLSAEDSEQTSRVHSNEIHAVSGETQSDIEIAGGIGGINQTN